jgi:outer membrane lipoprotein-sorting protein
MLAVRNFILTVFAPAALAIPTLFADTIDVADAQTIVTKANQVAYYQGADGRATVKMTITDSQDRTRNREFTILRRDEPAPQNSGTTEDAYTGNQKMYVYFHRPADVNKMVFMVWKHIDGRDDDRWLYLPALDLVKRIAASDKRTSFVGSHFFYEDVSGRSIDADTHELVEATDTYFLLKSTPKKPEEVEFGYFKTWVHRATFLPYRTEYYTPSGELYRLYEALEVKEIQGFQTVVKSKMTDLQKEGATLLEYSDVQYDIGLPDDIFTERYLRRAPRRFLR